jgi:hypothetical protein
MYFCSTLLITNMFWSYNHHQGVFKNTNNIQLAVNSLMYVISVPEDPDDRRMTKTWW